MRGAPTPRCRGRARSARGRAIPARRRGATSRSSRSARASQPPAAASFPNPSAYSRESQSAIRAAPRKLAISTEACIRSLPMDHCIALLTEPPESAAEPAERPRIRLRSRRSQTPRAPPTSRRSPAPRNPWPDGLPPALTLVLTRPEYGVAQGDAGTRVTARALPGLPSDASHYAPSLETTCK